MLAVTFGWVALVVAPTGIDVAWTAPPGCPTGVEVAREIELLLGDSAVTRVEGRIDIASTGYRLELRFEGAEGPESRALETAECHALGRAAALMVAVGVDPVATGRTIAPMLEDSPEPPEVVEPPPVEPVIEAPLLEAEPVRDAQRPASISPEPEPPTPSRSVRGEHRVGLGAFGGGGWGLVPGGTGGVEAEIGWLWGRARVSASGQHWFSGTEPVADGVSIAAALTAAALRGCYALPGPSSEFPVCAIVNLGALHGGGNGPRVMGRTDADLYVGVGAGVGANWVPRPRFALRTRLEVVVAARNPGFHLDQGGLQQEGYRMPVVSIRLALGPQLRLP